MIKQLRAVAEYPHAPLTGVLAIAFVTVGRAALEFSILKYWAADVFDYMVVSFGVAYILAFFLYALALKIVAGWGIEKSGNPIAIGMTLGFFPPIIEMYFPSDRQRFAFFLEFAPTLFSPDQAIGESIVLWMMVLFTGLYVGVVTGSTRRGFAGAFAGWALIHISTLIVLASRWLRIRFAPDLPLGETGAASHIATLAFCVLLYLLVRLKAVLPSMARLHHSLPHVALVACGAAWTSRPFGGLFALSVGTVVFVIFTLLIHNDYYDRVEDEQAGRRVGAQEFDVVWSSVFLGSYLFLVGAYAPMIALLAGLLFLAGTVYHHPSTRLKARFCLSYLCEGTGAATAFAFGAAGLASFAEGIPIYVPATLVFFGGAMLSAVKDYKDVDSDRAAGHVTFYTIWARGADGVRRVHARIAFAVLVSMLLPPALVLAKWGFVAPVAGLPLLAVVTWIAVSRIPSPRGAVSAAMLLYAVYLANVAWTFTMVAST